jgi:hypothetical protein
MTPTDAAAAVPMSSGIAAGVSPAPGIRPPDAPAAATPVFEGTDAGGPAQVEAILRRVQDERGALGGILAQAAWVEIADGALLIAFDDKHTFFREKIESRDTADYLRTIAREVTGRSLQVRPLSTAAMTRPAAPPAAPRPAPGAESATRPTAPVVAPAAATAAAPTTPPAGVPAAASPLAGPAIPAAAASRAGRGTPLPEERRRQLQDEALREPLVKSVLETFGAQIVDVDQA